MSGRTPVVVVAILAAGCGLVSGLDSLTVDGGATQEGGLDASEASNLGVDVGAVDAGSGEAGRSSGTALQTQSACATSATALSLSGTNFTIELWLRLDGAIIGTELYAFVSNGGATSPGWLVGIQNNALVFCVADSSTPICTIPTAGFGLAAGHLVHVAAKSAASGTARTASIFARDVTAGDTTHNLVGSFSSGPLSWTTTVPLTVGGAPGNNACAKAPSFTIDDLRVFNSLQSVGQMDTEMSVDISCATLGMLSDFKFNEGAGISASDCTNSQNALLLTQGQAFVASPFP